MCGRRAADLAYRHLAQGAHQAALPFGWQRLPDRTGQPIAHRVIQASAPRRTALECRVSAARRFVSNYQRRLLWDIEDIFRTAKSIIGTRPIFHQRDDTIRGHVFCSFLALLLRKELNHRLAGAGRQYEWANIIRDIDQIMQTDVEQAGRRLRLRAAAPGCAGAVFQAVGVALPPTIQLVA